MIDIHPNRLILWYTNCVMTKQSIASMFKPIIHEEDGSYWAEVPAMPGCFTVADTLEALRTNIIEAMQCWLLTAAGAENYRTNNRRRICRKRSVVAMA